jgi:tRNA/rRNA methyltransferase
MSTTLQERVAVVLVATRNSLNIGAAARAMSNFGFADLRLVRPWGPSFEEAREHEQTALREAAPAAVGAGGVLQSARVFETLAEAVADCTLLYGTTAAVPGGRRVLVHPVDAPGDAAERIREHVQSESARIAIVFGNEKHGLSNEELAYCHRLLRIPTRHEHISMNLGQAVAICLYEIACGPVRGETVRAESEPSDSEQTERLLHLAMEALERFGYTGRAGRKLEDIEQSVRRMLRRARLNRVETEMVLGMVRQALWRLEHP